MILVSKLKCASCTDLRSCFGLVQNSDLAYLKAVKTGCKDHLFLAFAMLKGYIVSRCDLRQMMPYKSRSFQSHFLLCYCCVVPRGIVICKAKGVSVKSWSLCAQCIWNQNMLYQHMRNVLSWSAPKNILAFPTQINWHVPMALNKNRPKLLLLISNKIRAVLEFFILVVLFACSGVRFTLCLLYRLGKG